MLPSEEKLSLEQYFTNGIMVQIGESAPKALELWSENFLAQHLAGTLNIKHDSDGDDGDDHDDDVLMTLMKKADILATEGKVLVKQIELKWASTFWAATTLHHTISHHTSTLLQCSPALHRCTTYIIEYNSEHSASKVRVQLKMSNPCIELTLI